MPNPILADLIAEIERNKAVDDSAILLINGFNTRLDAAVQAALANGATAAELQPVVDAVASFRTSTAALAAAVEANTPAA